MSDWIKVPNNSGHMAIHKEQVVAYYDVGVAAHAPDSEKGPRVRVLLKDLPCRTFFMTADAFGLLMEPPVAPVMANRAPGGYDPAAYREHPSPWPTMIPFPAPGADYSVLTTTFNDSTACGLSGAHAEHVTRIIREEVLRSGGQPFPWANIQGVMQSQGYGPGHFGTVHKIVAAWARGRNG